MIGLDVISLRIAAQNAALIIRRTTDGATIECFELSPRPADVLRAQGSLRRNFPAHAVELPISVFQSQTFLDAFCNLLSRLYEEEIEDMMPKTTKASTTVTETRDTASPELVTEVIMAVLAAFGAPSKAKQIQKKYRDDVLWNNAYKPWRRSALWLLLKISIQSTLVNQISYEEGKAEFKNFIAFFLCCLLERAITTKLPNQALSYVQRKLARRIHKLSDQIPHLLIGTARQVIAKSHCEMNGRWTTTLKQDGDRQTTLKTLTLQSDTIMALSHSRDKLAKLSLNRTDKMQKTVDFVPNHHAEYIIGNVGLPNVEDTIWSEDDTIDTLAALERWVTQELPPWTEETIRSPSDGAVEQLLELFLRYKHLAMFAYRKTPEQLSAMLLCLATIWFAMDRITCSVIPLVQMYSPEIPKDFFSPLLLPNIEQMEQLRSIEQHIGERYRKASPKAPSIFCDPRSEGTDYFSTTYFNNSTAHQSLRTSIEEEAARLKSEKAAEWQTKADEYSRLISQSSSLHCDRYEDEHGYHHADYACGKCNLIMKANAMQLDIYEWPLPENEAQAKAAIFELATPPSFISWRTMTWVIVAELGKESWSSGANPHASIKSYAGLSRYCASPGSRVSLSSTTKPFSKAHYKSVQFPSSKESAFCKNGLTYRYFDSETSSWVQDVPTESSLARLCAIKLPTGHYSHLQFAVNSTDHCENKVLASQSLCPQELSLQEYIAFGCLRADGEHTQWLNVSRELGSVNLDQNAEEVSLLIMSAIWQVGGQPVEETSTQSNLRFKALRPSHQQLHRPSFCVEIMHKIANTLGSIEANWQKDNTLQILIFCLQRILSCSEDESATEIALSLLQHARLICVQWLLQLKDNLGNSTEEARVSRQRAVLIKTALLCRWTYDMTDERLDTLMQNERNLEFWITASLALCENLPGSKELVNDSIGILLLRDRKLAWRAMPHVVSQCMSTQGASSLEKAIRISWDAFQGCNHAWSSRSAPNTRWLHNTTISTLSAESHSLDYNVLDGQFLVGGHPVGRLPKDYMESDNYLRLLKDRILPVFSSDMPGMIYMSACTIHGFVIYFGKRKGEVVIRLKQGVEVFELLARNIFAQDLPARLAIDFLHLLNLSAAEVDFWPLEDPWTSIGNMWRLSLNSGILAYGDTSLVDIGSNTFASALAILGCLDDANNIEVTLSGAKNLEISLPRLGLHFFLNDRRQLECKELRKVVDPDQSLGTLVGLHDRLILCHSRKRAQEIDRVLIIPQGEIRYAQTDSHVVAKIKKTGRNVHYFTYRLDSILGRLRGEGSLQSNLYKAHLHAVTSSILIDPFTSRTGTDQAVELLREQVILTSGPLGAEEKLRLSKLSHLTPRRVYYPEGSQVMQTVTWDPNLGSNAQHDDFSIITEEIRGIAANFSIFYPARHSKDQESIKTCAQLSEAHLLYRARARNSAFRRPDSGGNLMRAEHDSLYVQDRGVPAHADRVSCAFHISSCLKQWSPAMSNSRSLTKDLINIGTVAGFKEVFDTRKPVSELLKFSQSKEWGALWNLCCQALRHKDEYNLAFALSITAYEGSDITLQALQTILSFAFSQPLRDLTNTPQASFYNLRKGTSPNRDKLTTEFMKYAKVFAPKANSTKQAQAALRAEHDSAVRQDVTRVVEHYKLQWPSSNPSKPDVAAFKFLNVQKSHKTAVEWFGEWTRNAHFLDYVRRAQIILDNIRSTQSDYSYNGAIWQRVVSTPRGFQTHFTPSREVLRQRPPEKSAFSCMSDLETIFSRVITVDLLKCKATSNRASESNLPKTGILQTIIDGIKTWENVAPDDPIQSSYRSDLQTSITALQNTNTSALSLGEQERTDFRAQYRACLTMFAGVLQNFTFVLQLKPDNAIYEMLQSAGLWPNLAVDDILRYLARPAQLSNEWKSLLIEFAMVIAMIQKLRRLALAAASDDRSSVAAELHNVGPSMDCINRYPSWLLVQIDGDFMIRPIQQKVALAMISPSSMNNSLLQLNMGEGKSSVVIPLVVSVLANGEQLCRLIILKPLVKQMQAVLLQRVGGLVGRRTYYMPFSRDSQVSTDTLAQAQNLRHRCLSEGGILLAQPEHLLSFKLLGFERMVAEDSCLAKPLIDAQLWLQANSRDILDESDEILDVRFQLVYTLGFQRSMDGQPDRWLLVQSVLGSVGSHAMKIQGTDPQGIEVVHRTAGAFPTIYIRSVDAQKKLINCVVEDVLRSKMPNLNLEQYSSSMKHSTASFLSERNPNPDNYNQLAKMEGPDGTLMKKLLLLRGLFARGILIHVLKEKRWSVNYGLHLSRCLMAVPYRAKGVPAVSAEFAHPDVQLLLTCLSYYYTGLTYEQLSLCFKFLAKADEPSREYEDWMAGCGEMLPRCLRSYDAVNLEDKSQLKDLIWPALRFSKKVADYYLSKIVFPKEGKEFDQKLSSSGWDIPLQPLHTSHHGKQTETAGIGAPSEGVALSTSSTTGSSLQDIKYRPLSTGFSGTNDNRFLLPSSIKQRDLPELAHTSAKVLRDILQPENLQYQCVQNNINGQVHTRELIEQMIKADGTIRVLIDVGAQVIDVDNETLIHLWLEQVREVDAGIYFDAKDNIRVMTRDGRKEPLYTSSFQSRMDRCLVYLDEVHTRVCEYSDDVLQFAGTTSQRAPTDTNSRAPTLSFLKQYEPQSHWVLAW